MKKDPRNLIVILLIVIGALLWIRPWQSEEITVGAVPAEKTNVVAKVVTNDPPTEVVADRLVAQTNGLVRVRDVGGTVSYKSVSSKTSAPVVPENPYLNKN
jgi:hypothetical protein